MAGTHDGRIPPRPSYLLVRQVDARPLVDGTAPAIRPRRGTGADRPTWSERLMCAISRRAAISVAHESLPFRGLLRGAAIAQANEEVSENGLHGCWRSSDRRRADTPGWR